MNDRVRVTLVRRGRPRRKWQRTTWESESMEALLEMMDALRIPETRHDAIRDGRDPRYYVRLEEP